MGSHWKISSREVIKSISIFQRLQGLLCGDQEEGGEGREALIIASVFFPQRRVRKGSVALLGPGVGPWAVSVDVRRADASPPFGD